MSPTKFVVMLLHIFVVIFLALTFNSMNPQSEFSIDAPCIVVQIHEVEELNSRKPYNNFPFVLSGCCRFIMVQYNYPHTTHVYELYPNIFQVYEMQQEKINMRSYYVGSQDATIAIGFTNCGGWMIQRTSDRLVFHAPSHMISDLHYCMSCISICFRGDCVGWGWDWGGWGCPSDANNTWIYDHGGSWLHAHEGLSVRCIGEEGEYS